MSVLETKLTHYIDAGFPIIYINTFEEMKADNIIAKISKTVCRDIFEWDGSNGQSKWDIKKDNIIKHRVFEDGSLENTLKFLNEDDDLSEKILIIKDAHNYFNNPKIVSLIKNISHKILQGLEATIFIVSPKVSIPCEIDKYTTVLELGYLNESEIEEIIVDFIEAYEINEVPANLINEMKSAFKGLSEYEIKNILALAYSDDGNLTKSDLKLVHDQKQQIIKKSGILEMIELKEGLNDIGGLDNLKEWVNKKSIVFNNLDKAIDFGVDIPKGVLIAGMPGCGKSLNAKAIAKVFDIPLLRLDMGRLLGKYVGESEENMRKAISLAEAVSPCVLWIDELEKAFAGIGESSGSNDVTTRLFGNFLTWMQEKQSPTFVVATANNILKLPPELMRKGRFDETFYVGLPNCSEREKIFEIHIGKRRKDDLKKINTSKLADKTKGFSGADIEGIVKDAVELAFTNRRCELSEEDLVKCIESTKSLSELMKDTIAKMSKEYETRNFKNASV